MKAKELRGLFSVRRNTKALLSNEFDGHIRLIDSLRAISFHWVFWFHVLYVLKLFIPEDQVDAYFESTSAVAFLWRGTLAVDVFFVISGFLIAYLLILEYQKKDSINITRFYKRRFLRLMPVYYIAMLIIYVGYVPQFTKVQPDNTANIWANMLYINNFLPLNDQFMLWSWSLAVEEQFYLLFPFLFVPLMKFKTKVIPILSALLVFSLLLRWMLFNPEVLSGSIQEFYLLDLNENMFSSLYDKLYARFGAILCGIIAAFLYVYHKQVITEWIAKLGKKVALIEVSLLIFTLIILAATFKVDSLFGHFFIISHRTVFSILIAVLVLMYLLSTKEVVLLKSFLEKKFWYPFAQLSYSNYIWHPMCLFVFYFIFWEPDEFLTMQEIVLSIALSYFTTMLLSYLSFVFIEKPFMDLRKFMK